MKKVTVTILAILYMSASIGATINLHYCMGKLSGSDLWKGNDKSNKCGACGMLKARSKKGCCKDEQKQVKLNTDQKIVDYFLKLIPISYTAILPNYITYQENLIPTLIEEYPIANGPPLRQTVPIFILNCVFRI